MKKAVKEKQSLDLLPQCSQVLSVKAAEKLKGGYGPLIDPWG